MKRKIFYILFFIALNLTAANAWSQQSSNIKVTSWQNPVWDHDFPDPTVIRTADGYFYAYGTNGGFDHKEARIQVMRSKDGIHWTWLGDALAERPRWASHSPYFWAPDVIYDKKAKKYILYYAAKSDRDSLGMGIGMAVSADPLGPFVNIDTPLICGKKFEVLDPMAFEDPESGEKYMYWGSDFKPVMVQRLSDDWLSFASGSKAKVALYPDRDHDYDKLIEGPWVTYHQGYYYLFYSGDNCCGVNAHYAVMVACAKNPEGPFIRYSEAHDTISSVILRSNDNWMAPGHNSVVEDSLGNFWMYYHAIPRENFNERKYGRILLRDLITFKNGWPAVSDGSPSYNVQKEEAFTNPVLPSGADPWAIYHNGFYYYMQTMGDRLVLWKTMDLAALRTAEKKTIWIPPLHTAYSGQIWAPEIHFINGKWYVYFAADNGDNNTHRIYVLENASADPMDGNWIFKGKISDRSDNWAIDPSVFEYKNQWYMIWSGWEENKNGQQNIYIAKMKNPWTIGGKRAEISHPQFSWELHGDLKNDPVKHVSVNEGPEILQHKGEVFLIFSASGCWTNYYALGMLKLIDKNDLVNPHSWEKFPEPVFKSSSENSVYAPGHNGFFRSPDGAQDWIIYHANDKPDEGCGGYRSPRMQPFIWNRDGTPNFGVPVKTGKWLAVPSGTE